MEDIYKHASGVGVDNIIPGLLQGMFGLVEFANAQKLVSEKQMEVGPVGVVFCLEGEVINLGVQGTFIGVESDGIGEVLLLSLYLDEPLAEDDGGIGVFFSGEECLAVEKT